MSSHDARPDRGIDLADANDARTQLVDLVGRDRRVLMCGADVEAIGTALRARGCDVTTADHPAELGAAGAGRDLEVVLLPGVLDRVPSPEEVLAASASVLAPGGRLVASVANVAHGSRRLAALSGRWSETRPPAEGPLHRLDRRGLHDLLGHGGFVTDELRGTVADVLDTDADLPPDLPAGVVEWTRDQADAMVLELVVAAHHDPAAAPTPAPRVDPVVSTSAARPRDRHTDLAQQAVEDRHTVLMLRDHVLGLEASAASALHRATEAERAEKLLTRRLARKNDTIAALRRQGGTAPVTSGATWRRVGRRLAGRARSTGAEA